MIDFLIKSSFSLILLLGVYNLFLEKEKMSHFNRFYLLGSIIISFVIPSLKFDFATEALQNDLLPNVIQTVQGKTIIINQKSNFFPIFLWIIYGIITSLLAIRFGKNIYEFIRKIKSNTTQKFQNSILVLVEEKILPHTFLSYIFINKNDYENRKIEGELFAHELTHVRQKHTLDVLFIELLKTLFWFNPILIFYKKAIQLNHEFLADEKVVKSYNNVPFYQSLLLEKASWNSNFYLASNLNFLVTKKRLIMMTKTTSQSRALLKKLLVLPILAGLVFISCSKSDAEITSKNQEVYLNGKKVNESDMGKPLSELVKAEKNSNERIVGTTWETAKDLSSKKTSANASEAIEVMEVDPKDVPSNPEFPGGMDAFGKFVQKEFKLPADFKGSGNIIAGFVVETDGSISDIKIKRDLGHGTGEEAIRMLKTSPKWKPGYSKGKAVRVQYFLPIQLESEKM
jgi:hypothetical protein